MKDFLKQLQKKTDRLSSLFSRDKEKIPITPHRDWVILIFLFLLLITLSALLGLFLFLRTTSSEFIIVDESTLELPQIITQDDFEEGLVEYDLKKSRMEELLLNQPNIVDPS